MLCYLCTCAFKIGRPTHRFIYIPLRVAGTLKAQCNKLAVDAVESKQQFDVQASQLAKAELDAADTKVQFDTQLAKANLDAGNKQDDDALWPHKMKPSKSEIVKYVRVQLRCGGSETSYQLDGPMLNSTLT